MDPMRNVALIGPPLAGKYTLLKSISEACRTKMQWDEFLIEGVSHAHRWVDMESKDFVTGGVVRVRTFSGPLIFGRKCGEELLDGVDYVWYLTTNVGATDSSEESRKSRQKSYDDHLAETVAIARELGVGPSTLPWAFILNVVPGMGSNSIVDHEWVSGSLVDLIQVDAKRDVRPVLEFLANLT